MRGLVFSVMLAFAMSGAAVARHGGEGNHESEDSQGEHHHHHQPHNEHRQRTIILAAR